jgi:hypothetical protein
MNKSAAIWAVLIAAANGAANGQLLPDATCVALPPSGTSWSVLVEHPDLGKGKPVAQEGAEKKEAPAAVPVRLSVTAGRNGVSARRVTYSDGTTESFYLVQGLIFTKASNTGKIFALRADADDLTSLKTAAFPGTGWISKQYETAPGERAGRECFHYVYDVPEGDPERPPGKMEAWIQKKNLFPVEISVTMGTQMVFRFEEPVPSAQEVSLPAEYQEAFEAGLKRSAALESIRRANKAR